MNIHSLAGAVAHALGSVATINPDASAVDMLTAIGLVREHYAAEREVDLAVVEMNILAAEAEAEALVLAIGQNILAEQPK